MSGKSVEVIVKVRKSDWSWYGDNTETVFQERITIPANGLVDFVVPGSKVILSAKSLSLEVSNCCVDLCIGYTVQSIRIILLLQ